MDEAPLPSYARPCVYVPVFYSPSYMPGGGSLVIESEMEEKKEGEGGDMKMERDEEGG